MSGRYVAALLMTVLLAGVVQTRAADDRGFMAREMTTAPTIDGKLDEWRTCPKITMKQPNVEDLRVDPAALGWDAKNLYLAVRVTGRTIVNDRPLGQLSNADCAELRLCPAVTDRKVLDYVHIAPSSKDGQPAFVLKQRDLATKATTPLVETTGHDGETGVSWAVTKDDRSWTVEAAIPMALLGCTPALNAAFPFVLVVWDRDRTDIDEWTTGSGWHKRSQSSSQKAPLDKWPAVVLAGPKASEPVNVKGGVAIGVSCRARRQDRRGGKQATAGRPLAPARDAAAPDACGAPAQG